MGKKAIPGLYKRRGIWHIDKKILGKRITESTGVGILTEAEHYLVHRIQQLRNEAIYGIRPKRTLREAVKKYLEYKHKRSLEDDALYLSKLCDFIGDLPLDQIHMGTLEDYIRAQREKACIVSLVTKTPSLQEKKLVCAKKRIFIIKRKKKENDNTCDYHLVFSTKKGDCVERKINDTRFIEVLKHKTFPQLNHRDDYLVRWINESIKSFKGQCIITGKNRTINYALQPLRHLLKLAAETWRDEHGLTWLQAAPKIELLKTKQDERKPYPLSKDEQERLVQELPEHLRDMVVFAVNTGCRHEEVCRLRWEWEIEVKELEVSVFIVPGEFVKNEEDRLIVLNKTARDVIEKRRGSDSAQVFSYQGCGIKSMDSSAWRKARLRAGLPFVRIHDLKHTFGRRLRACGVSFEDRQVLLGHRSGRITTHYSAPELNHLIRAAETVDHYGEQTGSPTVLRLVYTQHNTKVNTRSRKTPAQENYRQTEATPISL